MVLFYGLKIQEETNRKPDCLFETRRYVYYVVPTVIPSWKTHGLLNSELLFFQNHLLD